MPFTQGDTALYRRDVDARGQTLSAADRERLLQPYLPSPPTLAPATTNGRTTGVRSKRSKPRTRRVRPFVKSKIHAFLYFMIHLVFGIYIRIRQIYHASVDRVLAIMYYHHRTPEYIRKDVKDLSRLPDHLSVILTFRAEEEGALEALMDEVAELCAWSAAIGIPLLSVYEKSGILKTYLSGVHQLVDQKLATYFGPAPALPSLKIFAPNHPSSSSSPATSPRMLASGATNGTCQTPPHLNLLLLSATDGRDTLVDLTRTLTEMSQSQKLSPKDITADLINAEISATTSISSSPSTPEPRINGNHANGDTRVDPGEPDLLIVFGPIVKLNGYPPWQIRLTEIFCVGDSGGDVSGRSATRVEYQGFLRGLWKYAGAEMRFGR